MGMQRSSPKPTKIEKKNVKNSKIKDFIEFEFKFRALLLFLQYLNIRICLKFTERRHKFLIHSLLGRVFGIYTSARTQLCARRFTC